MEPSCNGCGTPISELQEYWDLQHYVKGRYEWHKAVGPAFCEVCMAMMIYLLQKDKDEK